MHNMIFIIMFCKLNVLWFTNCELHREKKNMMLKTKILILFENRDLN